MSNLLTTTLNGREVNYYDAYNCGHLEQYYEAIQQGKICAVVGPADISKSWFFEYAVAKKRSRETFTISVGALSDVEAIKATLRKLQKNAYFILRYNLDDMDLQDVVSTLDGIFKNRTTKRLAGLELTLDTENEFVLNEVRKIAVERNWHLLEFLDMTMEQHDAYTNWLFCLDE